MHYLRVTNLTKSYSSKPLFDGIDFHINQGQKIALVAKNGAGKSTLLKVLMEEIDRSDGDIERNKHITTWFLTQDMRLDPSMRVIDALFDTNNEIVQTIKIYEELVQNPHTDQHELHAIMERIETLDARSYETKVKTILSKLRIAPLVQQTIWSLSGGEAKRVALAQILVHEPDFLLLDEPTNHLDLDMIERLENYLRAQNMTLLLVTHDRYFLERVCDSIFELDRGKLHIYPGNYSYFLEKKAEREEHEAIHVHNMKKLRREELERVRKAPRARGKKSVFREDRFGDIQDAYHTKKAVMEAEKVSFEIAMKERRLGAKILKLHNVCKSFGDKKIVTNFSHEFKHKERLGIIGKNGVGKTTFIHMLMDLEPIDSGSIRTGETVHFGHYQQKDIIFPETKKVIDVVRDVNEYLYISADERISASQALEMFLFPATQQHTFAHKLSGGEKRRLHLLTVLMRNPNFLILDEPTNDLDLLSIGVLENFLLHYQGCLIVISHDRFFMDKIVDHLFVFKGDGVIEDFWWTYQAYKEFAAQKAAEHKEKKQTQTHEERPDPDSSSTTPVKKKLSYNEQRELVQLEKELEYYEKRKKDINELFDNKDIPYYEVRKLSEELGDVIKQIERIELRRMELQSNM